jgi:hypothetical protein
MRGFLAGAAFIGSPPGFCLNRISTIGLGWNAS